MPGKMIYIKDENLENLKTVENMSGLINELLKDYFNSTNLKNKSLEQLELELKLLDLKEKHEKELLELQNGK